MLQSEVLNQLPMNKLSKISLVLSFILVMSGFSDVNSYSPHVTAINSLSSSGIINGYGDGTFQENNSVTRAELTKIVIGAKFSYPSGRNCFTDVGTECSLSLFAMQKRIIL